MEGLRLVFQCPEYQEAVLDTGYRKPLSSINLGDVEEIERTLRNHVILNVKSELDQFIEGLRICGIHDSVVTYSSFMAASFTPTVVNISKGTYNM